MTMRLQDYGTSTLFRLAGALCPHTPPRLGYWLADGFGDLIYRRGGGTVKAVRDNVRHILGDCASETGVDQVTCRVFRNRVRSYYDLFRLATADTQQVVDLVEVNGLEYIHPVQALGRGIIMASAHYGNPELLLHATAAALKLPILAVAEHLKPERVYQYMVELRTRHGLRIIPADGPLLEVYRTIRRGGAVALPLDRDTTNSGVQVQLLGAPAYLPDGYAKLAARTRAPLVVGMGRCTADNRVHLDLEPPYIPSQDGDRDEIYEQALDYGVQALARAITAHPDQWVLTTPIWSVMRTA